MPIDSNKPYPCFDKSNPTIVLGIPDNISRTFGTNKFTFTKANKISRISENPDAWCYIGDYFIHVNNAPWTDKTFLNKIKNLNNKAANAFIKKEIYNIIDIKIENDVYDYLINLTNLIQKDSTISANQDLILSGLYYGWHRCHVEERDYPSSIKDKKGKYQEGRKMFLHDVINAQL